VRVVNRPTRSPPLLAALPIDRDPHISTVAHHDHIQHLLFLAFGAKQCNNPWRHASHFAFYQIRSLLLLAGTYVQQIETTSNCQSHVRAVLQNTFSIITPLLKLILPRPLLMVVRKMCLCGGITVFLATNKKGRRVYE
jgi:hypothetical protein